MFGCVLYSPWHAPAFWRELSRASISQHIHVRNLTRRLTLKPTTTFKHTAAMMKQGVRAIDATMKLCMMIPALLLLLGVPWLPRSGAAATARSLQVRVPFTVTYSYRIDLNVTESTPSIDAAIDLLQDETLESLEDLVKDQDDPPLRFVDFDSSVQGMSLGAASRISSSGCLAQTLYSLLLQAPAIARVRCAPLCKAR